VCVCVCVCERERERDIYSCSSHLGLIRWRIGTLQEIEKGPCYVQAQRPDWEDSLATEARSVVATLVAFAEQACVDMSADLASPGAFKENVPAGRSEQSAACQEVVHESLLHCVIPLVPSLSRR
jgi:hypothetical protein